MKKLITIALIASFIGIGTSCKKKDDMVACIDGPASVELGNNVIKNYTWCGSGEEKVVWTCSTGQTSEGVNFPVGFSNPGKYTITATASRGKGKRKETITKTIEVEYGKLVRVKCLAFHNCFSGNSNIPNATGYKAYLYSSLNDWETDILAKNRNKVKDSVNCKFTSDHQTIYGEFLGEYTIGANYFVMIEGNGSSGASQFSAVMSGNASSASGSYGQITIGGYNVTMISLDYNSKKLFDGKWKLTYNELSGNSLGIPACNQDDYIKFYANGTWKYETGPDNCSGSSLPSNGTFSYINSICSYFPVGTTFTTLSGPFSGITAAAFEDQSTFRVDYAVGTNTGFMRFNYQAN